MFKVMRFLVVPYERRGSDLRQGEALVFYSLGEAQQTAERLRRRRERVDLFEVCGWPVQDLWDRPRRVEAIEPPAA